MPTRIKICGITRLQDAHLAVELGVAAIGFNLYPLSPRYIAPEAVRGIIRQLPPFVASVGIFANETERKHVVEVAHQAEVGIVQLHGPKFPNLDEDLDGFSLIRAVAVGPGFKPEELRSLRANAFLLDTFDPALPGGTGKSFDWNLAREAKRYGHIILAGGLTPENVAEAVREAKPFAVDVASGVESAPGVKDAAKLRAFVSEVERANREVGNGNRT